jgi:hypothetical protein
MATDEHHGDAALALATAGALRDFGMTGAFMPLLQFSFIATAIAVMVLGSEELAPIRLATRPNFKDRRTEC